MLYVGTLNYLYECASLQSNQSNMIALLILHFWLIIRFGPPYSLYPGDLPTNPGRWSVDCVLVLVFTCLRNSVKIFAVMVWQAVVLVRLHIICYSVHVSVNHIVGDDFRHVCEHTFKYAEEPLAAQRCMVVDQLHNHTDTQCIHTDNTKHTLVLVP